MGIDMTCIDLSVEDLLACSFGLSKREVAVLVRMLGASGSVPDGWLGVSAIAAMARRDRSVVQRALQQMAEKGVVERSQRNRDRGGYEYLYRARDKPALKRAILRKSRAFCRMVAGQVREW